MFACHRRIEARSRLGSAFPTEPRSQKTWVGLVWLLQRDIYAIQEIHEKRIVTGEIQG